MTIPIEATKAAEAIFESAPHQRAAIPIIATACRDYAERVTAERPETLKQLDCMLMQQQSAIIRVHRLAEKARKKHSVQHHHCDLRAAIDAICDLAKEDLALSKQCAEHYNNHEHATIADLRTQLAAAERQNAENERSHVNPWDSIKIENNQLRAQLATRDAEIVRLRTALEYYAKWTHQGPEKALAALNPQQP